MTKGKRETKGERVREILRKCGGGGMPVECKWIIKNLINRIGSALLPIYDVMIIHAEVVSRERIFIICLFKLFGRLRQRVAHPREIALLSLPFRINRVSRPDYWKLGSCPLYTLLQYVEARRSRHLFSPTRTYIYNTGEYLHKSAIRSIDLTLFIYLPSSIQLY